MDMELIEFEFAERKLWTALKDTKIHILKNEFSETYMSIFQLKSAQESYL